MRNWPTKAELQQEIKDLTEIKHSRESEVFALIAERDAERARARGLDADLQFYKRELQTQTKQLSDELNARPTLNEVRALVRKCFRVDLNRVLTRARSVSEIEVVIETAIETAKLLEAAHEATRAPLVTTTEPAPPPAPVEPPRYRLFLTKVGENWIGAIKAVREVSGAPPGGGWLGLKEAKDLVDAVREGQRKEIPYGAFGRLRDEAALIAACKTLAAAGCDTESERVEAGAGANGAAGVSS